MIWWALENASDTDVAIFVGLITLCFTVMSIIVGVDWIIKKIKKNNKGCC